MGKEDPHTLICSIGISLWGGNGVPCGSFLMESIHLAYSLYSAQESLGLFLNWWPYRSHKQLESKGSPHDHRHPCIKVPFLFPGSLIRGTYEPQHVRLTRCMQHSGKNYFLHSAQPVSGVHVIPPKRIICMTSDFLMYLHLTLLIRFPYFRFFSSPSVSQTSRNS